MSGTVDKIVGRPTNTKDNVAHYFRDLEISDWNRSKDCDLDKAYLEKLAENIKRNGLLCPIILVRDKKTGCLRVLAGAHRLAALKLLRGDDAPAPHHHTVSLWTHPAPDPRTSGPPGGRWTAGRW